MAGRSLTLGAITKGWAGSCRRARFRLISRPPLNSGPNIVASALAFGILEWQTSGINTYGRLTTPVASSTMNVQVPKVTNQVLFNAETTSASPGSTDDSSPQVNTVSPDERSEVKAKLEAILSVNTG